MLRCNSKYNYYKLTQELPHVHYQMGSHWINTTDLSHVLQWYWSESEQSTWNVYGNRANYSAQVCIYVFFKGDSKWHKGQLKGFCSGFEIHIHSSIFSFIFFMNLAMFCVASLITLLLMTNCLYLRPNCCLCQFKDPFYLVLVHCLCLCSFWCSNQVL